MTRDGEAGPNGTGPDAAGPTVTIPLTVVNRLCTLLGFAYEATWTAADDGELDFSTVGEPIVQALELVRAVRP